MNPLKMPRRRFDAVIHLCADSEQDFLRGLDYVRSHIKEDSPQQNYMKRNGTKSLGYTIQLLVDDNQTNESYYKQLAEYLGQKKGGG